MPTTTDRQHYLLAVENRQPTIVHTYGADEWGKAVNAQETLTDLARAKGIKAAELWYGVRSIDDDQGLVQRALEAAEKPQKAPEAPEEPKAKRVQTRTVEGVKLISQGERYWLSEDGKWEIGYMDDYETECEEPHPVKVSKQVREWYASLSDYARANIYPKALRYALQDNRRGYYCYGGATHYYALWHVVNTQTGDVIGRGDTFGDVLDMLGEHFRTGKSFG